jgi:uncharacterized protein YqhQ
MPKGEYLQYGGMAILEGVMMRSPNHFAVACRVPDGSVIVHEEAIRKNFARSTLVKIPILRGIVALIDSMALGIRAMNFSADAQLKYSDPAEHPEVTIKPKTWTSNLAEKSAIAIAIATGLGLSFLLFQGTPVFIAQAFAPLGIRNYIFLNIIEAMMKATVFLGYLLLISRMSAVKSLFQYHGAEHKAINCLEADRPLSIENVRQQTRLHPRCGTSFLVIVMILSMVTFTFVPRDFNTGSTILNLLVRVSIKLPVLPLLSGIAYELIRFAGKMKNQKLLYILFWPGLMTQYITTQDPEEKHIEVALASLQEVVRAEERGREMPEAAVATL